jgi:hypothetical protein
MTDPVNSMSQRAWQDSPEPIEKFGVWCIRFGRYWKFNIVSRSWVTASDAEKAALDAERSAGNPPAEEPKDEGLTWDNMKWMP